MVLGKKAFSITLCILILIGCFLTPGPAQAADGVYAPCLACGGSGACALSCGGSGKIECEWCRGTGTVRCGTVLNGDGEPIGCDGSGTDADGGVCGICGGTGSYPCDGCGGTGFADCACTRAGAPGVCHVCHGSGWQLHGGSGEILDGDQALWPGEGSRIASAQSMLETYAYRVSVCGSGVTPLEAMANAGVSSYEALVRAIRSGGSGGGSSSAEEGAQPPADGPSGQPDGSDGPDDPGGPAPEEEDRNENFYVQPVGEPEEIADQISDGGTDLICLLNRTAAEGMLLSVQIVKSELSGGERKILDAMTAEDLGALQAALEACADGLRFWEDPGLVIRGEDAFHIPFSFGAGMELPFGCDVLLQLPSEALPEGLSLYALTDGGAVPTQMMAIDEGSGGEHYLIFRTDALGRFLLTAGEPEPVAGTPGPQEPEPEPGPAESPVPEAPAEEPAGTEPPGERADGGPAAPEPDGRPQGRAGRLSPLIYIAIGAALACAAFAIILKIKRSRR